MRLRYTSLVPIGGQRGTAALAALPHEVWERAPQDTKQPRALRDARHHCFPQQHLRVALCFLPA